MAQLQPPHYYRTDDLQELNQKIQHRFIRDVVKPYGPAARKREYRIPDLRPRRESTTLRKTPIGEIKSHAHEKEINPYTLYRPEAFEPPPSPPATPPPVVLSCLDIHRHVHDCPICGRLYQSYSPVYIGIILILVLVIAVLLKQVVDGSRGLKTQKTAMETS
ncbi:hypothetical protein EBZ80_13665 [bacterium]|nr:hypothetical protein [bacterium]